MLISAAVAYFESRVGQREATGIDSEDVESFIATALERTKEFAVSQGNTADGFERQDSYALDGNPPFSSCALAADVLPNKIMFVRHASSTWNFTRVSNVNELNFIFVRNIGHWALENGRLYLRAPDPSTDPLMGNALVTVVAPVAIGSLPQKFEPYFLDQLESIGRQRLTGPAPVAA